MTYSSNIPGYVVFWNLSGETTVAKIAAAFDKAGLEFPADLFESRKASSAFLKALEPFKREYSIKTKRGAKGTNTVIASLVYQDVDPSDFRTYVSIEGTLYHDGVSLRAKCPVCHHLPAIEDTDVCPYCGHDLPQSFLNIRDEYKRLNGVLDTTKRSREIREYMFSHLDAVAMSKAGRPYFVKADHSEHLYKFQEVVQSWGAGDELLIIPVHGVTDDLQRSTFEGLEMELKALLDKVKTFTGRKIRESTREKRLSELRKIREKVEFYADLLGAGSEILRTEVDRAMQKAVEIMLSEGDDSTNSMKGDER